MKKIFITSAIALALILGSAASASAVFSSPLTIGSKGADVTALQTWLITNNFDIPAISSGAATKGYFGQQTKMAVVKYQTSVGLPSTGFVGPLTIAKLNGVAAGTMATAPACNPVYYNCTPVAGVTPVVVAQASPLVMDGTDGSITASLSSYAGNNTIKKGETKDLVAVKLQATAAPVSATRFDVRFNTRPWLYFSTITLKDSTGTVIATKNLSGSADATEITVGSDYLVRFEGINAVITPGTDRTFVVSGTVLSTTDKLTSDVTVIVSIPSSSIRTINGKGYTDSIGLGTVAVSGTSGRTITLSSSGSTGNILGKLSAVSPDNRIVTVSTSGETQGVVLGKFDFKSENRASTINTLTFTLKDNGGNRTFPTMFKRVYLSFDGGTPVQADSVATSSVFSNLTLALPQDAWKTVVITADVAQSDSTNTYIIPGAMASSTITVNTTNIVGIDSNFTTVTASAGNVVSSNDITFLVAGASVTAPAVTVSDVDNGTSAAVKKNVSFKFTFNNTGTTDLYLTTDPYRAVATSSTIATTSQTITATTTRFTILSGGESQNGDSASVFIVSAGKSRAFTLSGIIDRTRDQESIAPAGELKITKVYFGDDTTNIQESNVNFGLTALTTGQVVF